MVLQKEIKRNRIDWKRNKEVDYIGVYRLKKEMNDWN